MDSNTREERLDAFYQQFQFIHALLPYFPATNRTFFSYMLYFLEFRHMCEAFRVEQDLLNAAPEQPDFPDTETLISMLTKNMPQSDVERIKKMMDMMKMMEMMESMNSAASQPASEYSDREQPPSQNEAEPGFGARMQGLFSSQGYSPKSSGSFEPDRNQSAKSDPPPAPPPGINNEMLKRMMSPKQQELFAQYQNLFKNE